MLLKHIALLHDIWMINIMIIILVTNKVSQIYPTELHLNKANSFFFIFSRAVTSTGLEGFMVSMCLLSGASEG